MLKVSQVCRKTKKQHICRMAMAGFWDLHDYEDYRSTAWLDPEERKKRDAAHENREAYWARQEEALVRHDHELRDQYYGTLRFPYQQASLWLPPEEHMPAPSAPQHISYAHGQSK